MSPIDEAVTLLAAGQVIGLPTETVYGLAADATQPRAVRRIFEIKGRPPGHPLIAHLHNQSWLSDYCTGDLARARTLAARFWPGPLTMILPRRPDVVPDEVTGGLATVGVRVPDHRLALEVIGALGRAVAAPSANRFGGVSPTTRAHVLHDLGDDVPLVLDGGSCAIGIESTIIDLSRPRPYLLRPGAITACELADTLGETVFGDDGLGPAAPGTLESHYAPRAELVIVESEQLWERASELASGCRVGVLALFDAEPPVGLDVAVFRMAGGLLGAAHELYAGLRELDELGCEVIVSPRPPPDGIGCALTDRLGRAAAPRPRS